MRDSGLLGPKTAICDTQVPVKRFRARPGCFTPQSNYFLRMHVNYPTAADREFWDSRTNPAEYFLPGNCASIGAFR